jgi:hypothetical protein
MRTVGTITGQQEGIAMFVLYLMDNDTQDDEILSGRSSPDSL